MSKIYEELKSAKHAQGSSHIPAGLRIKGEISGSEDLIADGTIEGPVSLRGGILSIGETGSVKGNIVANQILVHGAVTGNVEARDRVEIRPNGSIIGDIVTSRIVIDDGAHCKGSIDVGSQRS